MRVAINQQTAVDKYELAHPGIEGAGILDGAFKG